MAAEENRNFRSYYYDKVGFRGVEEKKSLEILLKDKPLDVTKLSQFCLRFTLPSMYREYVWKVLLGVLSANPESHSFMQKEHAIQCQDLRQGLLVTRQISDKTPVPEVLLKMLLLEEGHYHWWPKDNVVKDADLQYCLAIATAMTEMFDDEVDAYWMTRNFCQYFRKHNSTIPTLTELLYSLLEKEDFELCTHLTAIKAFTVLPTDFWFGSCFATILHENSLKRIWDKIIGGACKFLAFVAAALLMTLRHSVLKMQESTEVVKYASMVSEYTAEAVVTKALDLWQMKHRGQP